MTRGQGYSTKNPEGGMRIIRKTELEETMEFLKILYIHLIEGI